MESEGNVLNTMLKENVNGQKHPERCVVVEPKLQSFRKPNYVVPVVPCTAYIQVFGGRPWSVSYMTKCSSTFLPPT